MTTNADIKVMAYEKFAPSLDAIIAKVQAGETGNVRLPWNVTREGWPCNWNGVPYRGINTFLLSITAATMGYESNVWLTFKKVGELGGKVRKGEHGSFVTFWKRNKYKDKDADGNEVVKTVPMMRYYKVWNLDQTEDVKLPKKVKALMTNRETSDLGSIDEAEAILASYLVRDDAPTFREGGDRAFYSPSLDGICIPRRDTYDSIERFYATANHEISHSAEAEKRLDMRGNAPSHFGDEVYSKGELRAQMAASMLCGIAGIDNDDTRAFDIEYLTNWAAALKADKTMLVNAASEAQRIVDYILGTTWDNGDE